ncbi:MAG: hypothetical protein ABJB97_10125 [Acidobacteriota bacterium]
MISLFNQARLQSDSLKPLIYIAILILSVSAAPNGLAQRRAADDDDKPLFQQYRGIQIGMPAADVRKKLGNPADKSDEQDFFNLSDNESAQIFYDKTHAVMAISANFLNGAQEVPTPKALFGSDVAAKADGSVYKMVRYTKLGYWLAYSKTSGDSPLITVTLQKID